LSMFPSNASPISIRPKVWARGDHLYARTPYPIQALTLFAFARKVHVDRRRRIVEIQDARWWISTKSMAIPFDRVVYIDSQYGDLGLSWGHVAAACWARTDKWERFVVSLVLREPAEKVRLFSFTSGGTEGPEPANLGLDGDDIVNSHGEHGRQVRFFIEKLHEFLQVPVGSETGPVPDARTGVQYECSICKRPSLASRDTCWSCGSPVHAVLPSLDEVGAAAEKASEADVPVLDLDLASLSAPFSGEEINANG
jgi:hypothetical protein